MKKFKIGDLTNLGKIMDITVKLKDKSLYYVSSRTHWYQFSKSPVEYGN
jgi:hypothetical protein